MKVNSYKEMNPALTSIYKELYTNSSPGDSLSDMCPTLVPIRTFFIPFSLVYINVEENLNIKDEKTFSRDYYYKIES